MKREYFKWYSPALNREMELLAFGHAGQNMLAFPTSKGRFFDWEGFGMIDALAWAIDRGWVQVICVDSVDAESWYNYSVPPWRRILRHEQYDAYVRNEVVPFVVHRSGNPYIATAGCSFGGYHAANFAFRHPDVIRKVVAMSGMFDIKPMLDGYYDDHVYYNNPLDYLPGLSNSWYLDAMRQQKVFLGASPHEPYLDQYYRLADLLGQKGVPYRLDIPPDATHDWPFWRWYVNQCL
ncbi:MAG TPA: alpha/beta hydrolase-fold protein [Candidatus Nitrosotenuis sp.]|jgi:esterase/lipase superfamily enzyme|nr:alpha/beta hydrolase-fold protein [Candidatus Nitrosotenuis sp.]